MQTKNIHLGIHKGHNSAISILDINKGSVIGNLEVERVTRIKNDDQMDHNIIAEILNRYGIRAGEVRSISTNFGTGLFNSEKANGASPEIVKKTDIEFFENTIDCVLVDHHFSHALSCALSAPEFNSMVILTSDGVGDYLNTCAFFISRDSGNLEFLPIMRSYALRSPSSIWFYVAQQNYKLDGLQGPGKLMALSAYGESKEDIEIEMFNHFTNPVSKYGFTAGFSFDEDLSDTKSKDPKMLPMSCKKQLQNTLRGWFPTWSVSEEEKVHLNCWLPEAQLLI